MESLAPRQTWHAIALKSAELSLALPSSSFLTMAEAFGVVAGALSVASLFNNAVDCFEYIQLGRNFGTDYQTCQIRLDIARLRLSRWGPAVDIDHNPDFAVIDPSTDEARTAKRTLEQLLKLFRDAHTQSYDFKSGAREEDLAVFDPRTNTNQGIMALRTTIQALTRKRQKSTGLSKKISWALYKQKYFSRLIDDIQELLDGLEKIFPVQETYKRLVEDEVGEVQDETSLRMLLEASLKTDELLRAAAVGKLERLGSGNSIGKAKLSESAKVKVGNEYVSQAVPSGTRDGTTMNKIGDLEAIGQSKVHVGDSYGGRGFFFD
ncbi:uncharacterized protein K441DRAFT_646327 [Cenococcum geophilum 1.58]|uniref:uncharacterized protein n=1 Tax=Cenococcum geophilum 1.58 TaxID=794803 RepID=UPI00358F8BC2|nr:hypothetical protein K441DRAFT_646327 [Cenococcum geophilum 1.58]